MDEQQSRIIEDLSGVFAGQVRCDELAVAMYSSDASLFQVRPIGVAFPTSRDDVVTLAQYASESGLPLIARGAGTNVTGSVLGHGLVVDFSRHMRNFEFNDDSTVTVQPGVVLAQLNRELRERGRYFPPDPSNAAVTTLGGMLGVDAAGSRAVRVGSTRDHVESLELVLAGGHLLKCGTELLEFPRSTPSDHYSMDEAESPSVVAETVKLTILSRLSKLLSDHADLIEKFQPGGVRNTSGYFLRGVLGESQLHLQRMLVGSEGTLGLISSARLHTSPLPDFRGVALVLFGQIEQAIDGVQAVGHQQLSACDLLDRRLLMLGRENDARFESLIPAAAEAGLLLEQTGFSEQQARDRIEMAVRAIQDQNPEAVVACEAYSYDDVEFLWELPQRVVSMLTRTGGESRPLPFVEDFAVPPAALQEFFTKSQKILQDHEVTASLYSHAASGQIHIRPFMPVPRVADSQRLTALAADLTELVMSLGGSISGEHGDGLSRSGFVRRQFGELYPVFQQIKDIFDPHNLMNPGKVVTEDGGLPGSRLRPEPVSDPEGDLVQLQLNWTVDDVAHTAEACNGCGVCRSQNEELRMCPFFRNDPSEESSPRAKANVFRRLVTGDPDPAIASSAEMQQLASLCFNCKQCELECPTNAGIPQLMLEARAQSVEAAGLDRATWILSRAHSFGALGCRFSWLSNWVLKNRLARWVMEKILRIHRHRKLPDFAAEPYLDSLDEETTDRQAEDRERVVVYFIDHFANYHDPELARAFVAILEHHGFRVHVPGGQTGSGMAMVTAGDLNAARDIAEQNVRELAGLAREGIPILCTEPAAALCLRDEYPRFLEHEDAESVSEQTVEAGEFLWSLHEREQLKDDLSPLPLTIGYHTPCHLKALKSPGTLRNLLGLIPDLVVTPIEKGCSGMAGTFGLTRDNFDMSIRIGMPLIERMQKPDLMAGATECSSCRIQMEQGTTTPTIHPIKLLAASWGLMPELHAGLLSLAEEERSRPPR